MLVSIVISNYNYEQFLRQAIDSALDQSYPYIQVVVVDDASTDGSRDVIDEYDNVEKCLLSSNVGQNCALNEGFRLARGEIVIFLDSDDFLTPDAVALHVERFRANPKASKSQGYLRVVDGDGNPGSETIPRKFFPPGDYKELTLARGIGVLPHTFTSGNAWSRWFLDQVMPLPGEVQDSAPDGCLNTVSTLYGPIEVVNAVVCNYRIHGENRSVQRFEADNLRGVLSRAADMREYLAAAARELGYSVDIEAWHRHMRSWRDQVMARSLYLMDGRMASPRFRDFVLAPFVSGRTKLVKALVLSAALSVVWVLPRSLALPCCARMIGYESTDAALIGQSGFGTVTNVPSSDATKPGN